MSLYITRDSIRETWLDYPSPDGSAVIAFFEGCTHHCPGCQSPTTWSINEDHAVAPFEALEMIETFAKRCGTDKVVISGGDAFCYSRNDVIVLIHNLKAHGYHVCVYTGYYIADIDTFYKDFERYTSHFVLRPDYVKAGPYVQELKEEKWGKSDEEFRLATKNQGWWRCEASREKGCYFVAVEDSKDNVLYFPEEEY